MPELLLLANLFKFFLLVLFYEVEESYFGSLAASRYLFLIILCQRHDREVLSHYRIGLLPSGCFVSDCVERPFYLVDGHPVGMRVVDTDPPEPHRLQFLLKLRVNTEFLTILKVDKRTSNLSAVVMLPKVLA